MNIVFIPVRGGSKSIPLKNIKALNGKPLIYWALKASLFCEYADKVYISTDSDEIKEVVKSLIADKELSNFDHKLSIVDRSNDTATDTASTESAMLEFANKYDFDNICLVQATSPLLQAKDLENGFEVFSQENVDSVLSVVKQKRFYWHINNIGYAEAINYDYKKRPRRQEFDGYYVENGAFYITSKENLLKSKNRISGNIKLVEMNECSYYEIDEPDDFLLIESIMKLKRNDISIDKSKIKMVLSDVDGCLTDGGMYYSENGDEIKKFNAKDGMAFRLLKEKGYITGIVTGENVDLNKRRVAKIGLDVYEYGTKDKLETLNKICKQYNISMKNILYIGDDNNDIDILKNVGISCCPNDAIDEVKRLSTIKLKINGGHGVVREVLDFLIE